MIASWPVTDFSQFRQIHVPKPSEIIQHLSNIHQTTCNGSSCPSSTQDEIHTIVGAGGTGDGGGAIDAGNIMKPALSRGELQAIPGAGCIHMSNDLQNDVISFYFNSFHNFHIGSTWFNIENVNMVWLGMTCDIATYWNKIARCKMYRTLDVVVCWKDLVVYFSASLQSKVQTSLQLCLVQIWLAGHWRHYHWGVQEVHREGQGPLTINLSNRQSCCNQVEHVISINIRKLNNMIITYSWFFIQHNDTLPMLLPFGAGFFPLRACLEALERCFQPVNVPEPTNEETLTILQGLAKKYEDTGRPFLGSIQHSEHWFNL